MKFKNFSENTQKEVLAVLKKYKNLSSKKLSKLISNELKIYLSPHQIGIIKRRVK